MALGIAGCQTAPPSPTTGSGHPLDGITDFEGVAQAPPELFGRVTVLDFWASWCAPCRQGFRYLDQLFRTFQGDGLDVLAISVDGDPQEARQFYARLRPRFKVAWDPGAGVRERFRVASLPTTILLDQQAKVVHRHEGFDPDLHRVLESQVRRLLRGA